MVPYFPSTEMFYILVWTKQIICSNNGSSFIGWKSNAEDFGSKITFLDSNEQLTSWVSFDPLPSHQQAPSAICVGSEWKNLGRDPATLSATFRDEPLQLMPKRRERVYRICICQTTADGDTHETLSMRLSFALLGSSNMGIRLERGTTGLQRVQILLLLIHVTERQGRAPSTSSISECHLANSQKGWLDPLGPADTLLTCFRRCSGKTSSTGLNLCNTHF